MASKKKSMRIISVLVALGMVFSAQAVLVSAQGKDDSTGSAVSSVEDSTIIEASAANVIDSENVTITDGVIHTLDTGYVEFSFNVPESGEYIIEIDYTTVEGRGIAIERSVSIDGELPFEDADDISIPRIWKDAVNVRDSKDKNGNEVVPQQVEDFIRTTDRLRTDDVFNDEPLRFELTAGEHILRITSQREPMDLHAVRLIKYQQPLSYEAYIAQYAHLSKDGTAEVQQIEAEQPAHKSDPMVYPIFDRSSSATQPVSTKYIVMNTIGGERWKISKQWVEWELNVPEDGLYKIALRYRQNIKSGFFTSRRLQIDGSVPFVEASNLSFDYDSSWTNAALGNADGEYLFYLEKGTRTLRLEVTLGDMQAIVEEVEDILLDLNNDYRQILMLIGSTPDQYRDYEFEKELPEVLENLAVVKSRLEAVQNTLVKRMGGNGEQTSIFQTLILQLEGILDKPRTIAQKFQSFKENIAALGSWSLSAREQPLEIDYITLTQPACELKNNKEGFFKKIWHELQLFLYSFGSDYNNVSYSDGEEKLTVWSVAARDQTNMISRMINNDYSGAEGIKLQMVAAGSLLPSILAGKGPDVALSNGSADVMNLAARGVLTDFSELDGFQDVTANFKESALIPLQYNGGTYALPESQSFPVLFYRQDILDEIGVGVPETWDDVISLLPELQRRYMNFGLPFGMASFPTFLYQMGGSFYTEDYKETALGSDIALKALKMETDLFNNYSLEIQYDFANRFRTGEMPLAIADYTVYNQLTVFAPEINGLWGFAPVPGMVQEDGSVNHSTSGTTTGTMMLAHSTQKERAWDFIKWWVSTETQVRYGREQESLLGTAARYASANVEAMKGSNWEAEQAEILLEQWEDVKAVPEVPGSYYTGRYVDFAFRKIVINKQNYRRVMMEYVDVINKEIAHKREEFKLDQ